MSNMVSDGDGVINILDLNDDCLLAVFDFLTLTEQIEAARACEKFRNVFKIKNLHNFKTIRFYDISSVPICLYKDLLSLIGDGVEEITTDSSHFRTDGEIYQFAALYCVNVKKIEFAFECVDGEVMETFIQNCPMIQEICLRYTSVNDSIIERLKYFPNLENLHIIDNFYITGKHLKELINLKELCFERCNYVESQHLNDAVAVMKNLHTLKVEINSPHDLALTEQIIQLSPPCLEVLFIITDGKGIMDFNHLRCLKEFSVACKRESKFDENSMIFENLVGAHSHNLQVLRIVGETIMNPQRALEIAKLKNLKKLTLNQIDLDINVSRAICELRNLEEIVLTECYYFTKEKLINIVEKCHKLQYLITWEVIEISKDIIESIVPILRDQLEHRMRSYKLTISDDLNECRSFQELRNHYTSPELEVYAVDPIYSDSDINYESEYMEDSMSEMDSDLYYQL